MTPLSTHSPRNSGGGQRRAAAIALTAAALALIAGCTTSTTSSTSSTGNTGTTGTTGTTGPLTPRKAIRLAAAQSKRESSMAATFAEQIGSPVTAKTIMGTMQLRLKPTLLPHETLRTPAAEQTASGDEIVSAKAVYLKGPTGPAATPWL